MPETIALGPRDEAPGRPFTAVDLIERDASTLLELLADVRSVLHEAKEGRRTIEPYQRLAWNVDGLAHRLIICNEQKLRFREKTCAVGFFGERRTDIDSAPLEEANTAIVAEFTHYPGILSYSSVELAKGRWANLVLHDDPIDREYWRGSQLHAEAVRLLSPVHYRNVRIHNAELTDALTEDPKLTLERTKYYDFDGGVEWRAERDLLPT